MVYLLLENTDTMGKTLLTSGPAIGSSVIRKAPTAVPVWTSIEDFDEGGGTAAAVIGDSAGYIPLGDTMCLFSYLLDNWLVVAKGSTIRWSFWLDDSRTKGWQNWNECFRYDLPLDGDDRIVKVFQYRDKLLVFTERSIWALFGGSLANWTGKKLHDDIGITSTDHVVWTPYGLCFLDCRTPSVWMMEDESITDLWNGRIAPHPDWRDSP